MRVGSQQKVSKFMSHCVAQNHRGENPTSALQFDHWLIKRPDLHPTPSDEENDMPTVVTSTPRETFKIRR